MLWPSVRRPGWLRMNSQTLPRAGPHAEPTAPGATSRRIEAQAIVVQLRRRLRKGGLEPFLLAHVRRAHDARVRPTAAVKRPMGVQGAHAFSCGGDPQV